LSTLTGQHFTSHYIMGFKTGVFGSSPERVQWRLIRVMISMWIMMTISGIVLNYFFGTPLWTLPELYLVGLIAFHSWHWASHQRWLLYPMWKLHMYHHLVVYPPSRFFSRVYEDDEGGRTILNTLAHDGPLYAAILTNVAMLYRLDSFRPVDVIISLLVYGFVSSFGIWLHQAFHIQGHWMERFLYFHDLRALHYVHHQGNTQHNFGFLDHSGDIVGQSLKNADYSLSNSSSPKTRINGKIDASKIKALTSSSCAAGPMPTIAQDGAEECAFAVTCMSIEIIVRILGLIFGKVKRDTPSQEKKSDTVGQRVGLKAAALNEVELPSPNMASLLITDMFLFN
jgi:hypothetical protein